MEVISIKDIGDRFGFLIKQINLLNEKAKNNELNKLDITSQQAMIIFYLYRNKDKVINQKDIETKFNVSKASISGIVDRLEHKGYIKRTCEGNDGRCKNIFLNESGFNMVEKIIKFHDQKEKELVKGFTREEEDLLRSLLKRVKENIGG